MAYSAVEHIAASRGLAESSPMAFFQAYYDESVTQYAAAVAGCISTVAQWRHFEREWALLLSEERLSGFHMKDFAHCRRDFSAWRGDERRRREFLRRAIGIIVRRVRFSVGAVVHRPDFEAFVSTPERKRAAGDPYTFAARVCLGAASLWAEERGYSEPFDHVFDLGNAQADRLRRAFIAEKQRDPRHRSLAFMDDRETLPLQAADLIVYELSKGWTKLQDEPRGRPRAPVTELETRVPHNWMVFRKAELESLAHRYD